MKTALLALALITSAPLAHAQVIIQTPPGPPEDYWRQRHEQEEWRRRQEFAEEQRHEEWVRAHCVRDFRGEEYCRR